MKYFCLILWALIALPVAASDLMTADEFEAYVTGKTLFYGQGGAPYGAEIYLPDRQVKWSFLDGECKDGYWYDDAGLICFVYEDNPDPQCWSFEQHPGGLVARFENNPDGTELYEANDHGREMLCLGPKVGV